MRQHPLEKGVAPNLSEARFQPVRSVLLTGYKFTCNRLGATSLSNTPCTPSRTAKIKTAEAYKNLQIFSCY